MWKKISRKTLVQIIIIGILFFILNCLTHICVDDYSYSIDSCGNRVTSIRTIIECLKIHNQTITGRLEAHFWAYLFLMMPKMVFNIMNTVIFCALIILICYMSKVSLDKHLLLVSGFIWLTLPAFGQISLFLVGATNYLWAMVIMLLYLLPLVRIYRGEVDLSAFGWKWILLYMFGIYTGAYNENASAIAIFTAAIIIVIGYKSGKIEKKFLPWLIGYVISAGCGYILLLSSPATRGNKLSVELDKWVIIGRQINTIKMLLRYCWLLMIVWVVLFIILLMKGQRKRLTIPVIYLTVALISNEMYVASLYYVPRSMNITSLMLIIGCIYMVGILEECVDFQKLATRIILVATVTVMLGSIVYGTVDIVKVYIQEKHRDVLIEQYLDTGEKDVVLPQITYYSAYPGYSGLKNLNPDDSTAWQNVNMAHYFGLNTILGESVE